MKQSAVKRACVALFPVAVFISGCKPAVEQRAGVDTLALAVVVARPTNETVALVLPGRLEPYRKAEVRARVAGIVTERRYQEGQEVVKGDVLFQIESGPLQAAVDSQAAALMRAQATHGDALDKVRRYRPLVAHRAISERDHAAAVAQERQARADVALARANLRSARLKLGYACVTAPIDGRVRRALVTEGALVGEGHATPLTTIEQIDPIYVNFAQPATDALRLRKAISAGDLEGVPHDEVRVRLILPDGSGYVRVGTLSFADLAVDPGTDNVAMRAVFPNPERELLPGTYVQVRLELAVNRAAYLVPRDALLRTAQGARLMVADADGTVTEVPVVAERLSGANWVVTEGLRGGERIVVENAAQLRPGQKIEPVERAAAASVANPQQA
jgi:multidrug efflux system membrane fusion protein